jgi:hypothetical protein
MAATVADDDFELNHAAFRPESRAKHVRAAADANFTRRKNLRWICDLSANHPRQGCETSRKCNNRAEGTHL